MKHKSRFLLPILTFLTFGMVAGSIVTSNIAKDDIGIEEAKAAYSGANNYPSAIFLNNWGVWNSGAGEWYGIWTSGGTAGAGYFKSFTFDSVSQMYIALPCRDGTNIDFFRMHGSWSDGSRTYPSVTGDNGYWNRKTSAGQPGSNQNMYWADGYSGGGNDNLIGHWAQTDGYYALVGLTGQWDYDHRVQMAYNNDDNIASVLNVSVASANSNYKIAWAKGSTTTVDTTHSIGENNLDSKSYVFMGDDAGNDNIILAYSGTYDFFLTTNMAIYMTRKMTVTFNGNGGTVPSGYETKTVSQTFRGAGTNYYGELPTPTRTGYDFDGWYTESSGGKLVVAESRTEGDGVLDDMTCDQELYAHWTPKTYTVTLNRQGGETGDTSVTATFNDAMPSATMPSGKTGYNFEGYYTEANGGGTKYYNSDGSSAHNWTTAGTGILYANWTLKTTTVTLNQGSGSGGTSSVTATYSQAMPSATMPKQVGKAFDGYYDASSGGTIYYNADGSSARTWNYEDATKTLYAHWTDVVDYTVNLTGTVGVTINLNAAYKNAYSINKVVVVKPVADKLDGSTETDTYTVFNAMYEEINAAQMTDAITISLYHDSTKIGSDIETTVADILESKRVSYGDTANGDLCAALLVYGGYVQIANGYKTSDLAFSRIADSDVRDDLLDELASETIASNPGVAAVSGTLFTSSDISISAAIGTDLCWRMYFECDDEDVAYYSATSARHLTNNGNPDNYTISKTQTYRFFEIDDIKAYDVDTIFTVTVTNSSNSKSSTITYSVKQYLYNVLSSSSVNATYKNLAKAILLYRDYAIAARS